jgi:hypothetical protein
MAQERGRVGKERREMDCVVDVCGYTHKSVAIVSFSRRASDRGRKTHVLTSLDVPKIRVGEKATAEASSDRKTSTDFIVVYNMLYSIK